MYKPRTQDILIALRSEAQWLDLVNIEDEKAKALIKILQAEANEDEEQQSEKKLTIKNIASVIQTTPAKVTTILIKLYEEIWDLNWDKPELFTRGVNVCEFYFNGGYERQFASFKLSLNHPFTIGDRFSWAFLRGKFSSPNFFVESVHHEHQHGQVQTLIYLKAGGFNQYRQTLLEKARFLSLIHFDELMELPDYKIDELLLHRVELGKDGFPKSMEKEASYFEKKKHRW